MAIPKTLSMSLFLPHILLGLTRTLCFSQAAQPHKVQMELTGIVLTADHRCATAQGKTWAGRSSDWALASGRKTYLLYGDTPMLEKFERKQVNISGLLEEEPSVSNGVRMVRRSITVQSIRNRELSELAIEGLVGQLRVVPWRGPENHCSPMCWDFAFTDPMMEVLQANRYAEFKCIWATPSS